MLFIFKNGRFQGRVFARDALAFIHKGNRSLTVAQATAEGWEIRRSSSAKGETNV